MRKCGKICKRPTGNRWQ